MIRKNNYEYTFVKDEEVTGYKERPSLKIELTDNERLFLLRELTGKPRETTLVSLFYDENKEDEEYKNSIIRKLKNVKKK